MLEFIKFSFRDFFFLDFSVFGVFLSFDNLVYFFGWRSNDYKYCCKEIDDIIKS